jgi:hypothetical protein
MRARAMFRSLADEDFSDLESAVQVMHLHGLTDEALISVLALAGEVQRSYEIMFADLGPTVMVMTPPEEEAYLHFGISVKVGTTEVHEMNRELGRLVVERLRGGKFPSGMVASFRKVQAAQVRSAA